MKFRYYIPSLLLAIGANVLFLWGTINSSRIFSGLLREFMVWLIIIGSLFLAALSVFVAIKMMKRVEKERIQNSKLIFRMRGDGMSENSKKLIELVGYLLGHNIHRKNKVLDHDDVEKLGNCLHSLIDETNKRTSIYNSTELMFSGFKTKKFATILMNACDSMNISYIVYDLFPQKFIYRDRGGRDNEYKITFTNGILSKHSLSNSSSGYHDPNTKLPVHTIFQKYKNSVDILYVENEWLL